LRGVSFEKKNKIAIEELKGEEKLLKTLPVDCGEVMSVEWALPTMKREAPHIEEKAQRIDAAVILDHFSERMFSTSAWSRFH